MAYPPRDGHVHPEIEVQLSDLKIVVARLEEMQTNAHKESKEHRAWVRENMSTKDQVAPLIRIGWIVGGSVAVTIIGALMALILKSVP